MHTLLGPDDADKRVLVFVGVVGSVSFTCCFCNRGCAEYFLDIWKRLGVLSLVADELGLCCE